MPWFSLSPVYLKEYARVSKPASRPHPEAIGGMETIKSARGESRMQRRYETFVGKSAETAMWSRTLSGVAVNFSLFAQNFVTVGVVVLGVYLIMNGQLTVGGLVACSMLAGRAIAPLG